MEKNYQKPWGEIDIIAQNQGLIFIEVKTRTNTKIAFPEENVNFNKQRKLIRAAETYLLEKNHSPETPWQIDVIAIELNLKIRKANLKHIKNAVWE